MEVSEFRKKVMFNIILNILAISSLTLALQMDLYPSDIRCIGQELDRMDYAIFALSASSKIRDISQKVGLTVSDPDNLHILNEKITIGAKVKEIEYQIEKRGLYELCFHLVGGKTAIRVFFHVGYKPDNPDGKAIGRKVNKDEIPSMQSQLLVAHQKINEISQAIEHARKQEQELTEASDATSSRVKWFSVLSVIILLSTSLWQLIYLRGFFASKKLL